MQLVGSDRTNKLDATVWVERSGNRVSIGGQHVNTDIDAMVRVSFTVDSPTARWLAAQLLIEADAIDGRAAA